MVKNVLFPSSNVLFCPQFKDTQFTVIERKKLTFKKLEFENLNFFPTENVTQTD